MVFENSIE